MHVYVLATLDTKGAEADFVRGLLAAQGLSVRLVDTGCLGHATVNPDVSRQTIFAAADTNLETLVTANDRGRAVTAAAEGASRWIAAEHRQGRVSGVLGIGGSAGTTIGTAAMRALPVGIPKLMVSTLASGQVRPYVRDKDILMLNSIVDIAGLNRISRCVLGEAASAMAGMVQNPQSKTNQSLSERDKPLVAATMFGVTTPCLQLAREVLEAAGCEVLVFHATGTGGMAMESLIDDGLIAGVLDITTTELADELAGGDLSAGPQRLTAAGRRGVPQVVSVGALDMVNFGPPESVPEKFKGRKFHHHNATVTLMRTTVDENRQLGAEICRKLSMATGPTCLMLPLQGVSAIDKAGQSFDDPQARNALYQSIREQRGGIELVELNCHINDPEFARAAADKLLQMMNVKS